jgi:hypothetical protein
MGSSFHRPDPLSIDITSYGFEAKWLQNARESEKYIRLILFYSANPW